MEQCEFCGAPLATDASFCGRCGHAPVSASHHPTQIGTKPEFPIDENGPTSISPQGNEFDVTFLSEVNARQLENVPTSLLPSALPAPEGNAQHLENVPTHLLPAALPPGLDDLLEEEDEEEEKRRKAALLGLALPLAGALPNAPAASAPVLSGTPQLGQMPVLSGVPGTQPPAAAGTPFPSAPSSFGTPGSPLSSPGGSYPSPGSFGDPGPGSHSGPGGSGHPGPGGSGHPGPGGSPTGCLSIGLIISIVLLVILGSTATLGLTVFRPIITLTGNTSVAPGSTLALQGSSFLPNSSVILTLDGGSTPLYYIQRDTSTRLAGLPLQGEMNASQFLRPFSQGKQTVAVQGNGTFSISIKVDPTWPTGSHTIHASETLTHRGAALNFTITQAGTTVTPGVTSTVTSTTTATVTPTVTATTTTLSLSCATPGSLALGPLSEKSSQASYGTITLCTSGSDQVSWQASWNASWLQLSQSQGTIQAPNQFQITATASAAQLTAGNYQTTITFSSPQGNSSQTIQVSLNVQTGCVNSTPTSLSFSGVANTSDPASQSVSVTNCGLTSDWSASVTAGSDWLSVKPGHGTLNGGSSGKLTVNASNLKAGLKAGRYSGTIIVTIGSQTSTITVSLAVQDAPQLTSNTTSINGYYCSTDPTGGYDSCWVTLTNTSTTSSLTWSSSASLSGILVKPASATLAPGASERVNILVPKSYEKTKVAITFTGPGNSVVVDWYYQIIIT